MHLFLKLFSAVLFATLAISDARATMLTGSVSFDPTTSLYTYDYVVDIPADGRPIYGLSIRVDSVNLFWENGYLALPVAHTEPPAWFFHPSVSWGDILGLPGSYWGWFTGFPSGVQPGTQGHFSFSTERVPSTSTLINSYLYIGDIFADDILNFVDVDHIVAPDFLGGKGLIGGSVPDSGPWSICQAALFFGLMGFHFARKRVCRSA